MTNRHPWILREVSFSDEGGDDVHLNATYEDAYDLTDCHVAIVLSGELVEVVARLDRLIRERIDERLRLSARYQAHHDVEDLYSD